MIHRVHSTNLVEVNRVLELIQKQVGENITAQVAKATSAGGGTTTGTSVVGPAGPTGPAGADGSHADMLVGAEQSVEILLDANGDVLTDNLGYALLGVKVSSTIITGAGSSSFEVLNAT